MQRFVPVRSAGWGTRTTSAGWPARTTFPPRSASRASSIIPPTTGTTRSRIDPTSPTGGEHVHHIPRRGGPHPRRSRLHRDHRRTRRRARAGPGPVQIAGAAVNPPRDLGLAAGVFHRLGLVHQPDHTGLGWGFAGTVTATGPDVDLPLGAHVAGLVDGFDRDYGTYAEQLVVSASDTALVPDGLDLVTAATVPLNGLAAAQIADLLGDGAGRSLLVTGAAGAVGGTSSRPPKTPA